MPTFTVTTTLDGHALNEAGRQGPIPPAGRSRRMGSRQGRYARG
ncbi:uncharacterized protein METZ01_LOCUS342627, partial [marine metagenome]